MAYIYGTPSAEESDGLWKARPSDPDVDSEAYNAATLSLDAHLRNQFVLGATAKRGDLYLRGDFFGDRTQYLELLVPELIGVELIGSLQTWLRAYDSGTWRVVIPTYVEDAAGAIMVYPSVVRLGKRWEADPRAAYAELARLMHARDKHGTYKHTPTQRRA